MEGLIKKIYGTLIHVSFIIFISTHPVYPEVHNSESEVLWVQLSFLHLFTLVIAKNSKTRIHSRIQSLRTGIY